MIRNDGGEARRALSGRRGTVRLSSYQQVSPQRNAWQSAEDRTFHGRVLGVDDVVSFEGSSVDELEAAFREAVDDYLDLVRGRSEDNVPPRPR
jgi:hypothetical protein